LKVELPALETIEELDDGFRQHLFAQWVMNKNIDELRTKFKSFAEEPQFKHKESLDPTNADLVKSKIGDLITEMKFNDTSNIKVAIPQALRFALFNGWEEKGYEFLRLLNHYGTETKLCYKLVNFNFA
jgi:hypothetical protein